MATGKHYVPLEYFVAAKKVWAKGKAGSKGERQITVTNLPSAPSAPPPEAGEGSIRTEVVEALKRLSEDQSLVEYPFQSKDKARRAAIRKEVDAQQGKCPFEFSVQTERQGNKLRLVLRKQCEPCNMESQGLPDIRFDCINAVRKHLYELVCSGEEEFKYPTCLTKMQRSVVHEVARDFRLASSTKGARREEQVVVSKANRDNPSEPLVIHGGFLCDGCNTVPQGLRFHCEQCRDFDFCHSFQAIQAIPEVKKVQLLSSATNMGDTALHLACQKRQKRTIRDLLEAKADCNAQNGKGRTALHVISRIPCYNSSDKEELVGIMQALLNATGDAAILENNGDSPLHQARTYVVA
ncbi:HTK16 [Symbiodinium sp. CCMP2456]|nr:HTK16 [Symbiodinium sp. CCMP2456]